MISVKTSAASEFALLMLILLTGFILRFYHLDHSGIWLDEKISLAESNGFTYLTPQFEHSFTTAYIKEQNTFQNVVKATIKEDGGNGMLYILQLHYWQTIFGSRDAAIRMPSLLFSLLSIVAAFFITKALFRPTGIAITTALVMALHPLLIDYAQEARPYSMALFFSLCSTLFFIKAFLGPKPEKYHNLYCFLYFLMSLCSIMTHYLTAYIFLAQGVYFILYVKGLKHWLSYILCWLSVIIVFALWLINGGSEGLQHMSEHNKHYINQLNTLTEGENPFILPANLKNIFLGWMQHLLAATGNTLQQAGFRLREITSFLAIPVFFVARGLKMRENNSGNLFVFLFVLAFSSCAYSTVLALVAGHTISFQPAYSIFAAPFFIILISYGIYRTWESKSAIIKKFIPAAAFLLILISSVYFHYSTDKLTYAKQQSNPVIVLSTILAEQTNPADTIVFGNYPDAVIANIYLKGDFSNQQQVDTSFNNLVIIKNSKKVLFDFENGRHRY